MFENIKTKKQNFNLSINNKIEKYKIKTFFSILYSLIFLISAIFLLRTSIIASLAALLTAVILFPKSFEFIQKKVKIQINRDMKMGLIFVLFVLVSLYTPKSKPQSTEKQPTGLEDKLYSVEKVIDGDTVDVSDGDKMLKIRLIGIDAPETGAGNTQEECYAKESEVYLSDTLNGKQVKLEADTTQDDKDKYDRLLRYVYLDGVNVNKSLLENGYAKEYTYDTAYKYSQDFINAENAAKEQNLGLWNPQDCKN